MGELLYLDVSLCLCGVYFSKNTNLETIHSQSCAVTLSMTTHLNGHVFGEWFPMGGGRREKGGRCDDEIQRLSPDRLGTRPLIALDVMWMTSQDREHRFITCGSPLIHHQVNHCS